MNKTAIRKRTYSGISEGHSPFCRGISPQHHRSIHEKRIGKMQVPLNKTGLYAKIAPCLRLGRCTEVDQETI